MGEVVEQMGQRAFIGKVAMDCFGPEYYMETTEESLRSTEEFVANMLHRKVALVLFVDLTMRDT